MYDFFLQKLLSHKELLRQEKKKKKKKLRSSHTVRFCVFYGSQNKERLFPLDSVNWVLSL
jgi:hypothetical protein